MAIPSTPFASRSSMMRCCPAAVGSELILNSISTFGNSALAFSVPLRAIVQKSDVLLVMNAIRVFLASLVLLHEAFARINNEIRMKITLRPGDAFMYLSSYTGLNLGWNDEAEGCAIFHMPYAIFHTPYAIFHMAYETLLRRKLEHRRRLILPALFQDRRREVRFVRRIWKMLCL